MSETVIDGLAEQGGAEVSLRTIPDCPGGFGDRDSLDETYALLREGCPMENQSRRPSAPDSMARWNRHVDSGRAYVGDLHDGKGGLMGEHPSDPLGPEAGANGVHQRMPKEQVSERCLQTPPNPDIPTPGHPRLTQETPEVPTTFRDPAASPNA